MRRASSKSPNTVHTIRNNHTRPEVMRAERTNNEKEHFNAHLLHGGISGNLLAVRLENEGDSMDAAVLGGACG